MQINIKVFASWLCFFVSNYPKKKVSNIFAISLESVVFFCLFDAEHSDILQGSGYSRCHLLNLCFFCIYIISFVHCLFSTRVWQICCTYHIYLFCLFWGILMQKYYIKDTPKANFCKVIRCSRLRLWVGYCLF